MAIPRTARLIGLGVLTLTLSGCQLYWVKPGADMTALETDHKECIKIAGSSVGSDQLLVNLDLYRACLRARGWQREQGSKMGNPAGYYRGQEDEGPVRVGDVPKQTPTVEPNTRR
jgi:hypothetical protein